MIEPEEDVWAEVTDLRPYATVHLPNVISNAFGVSTTQARRLLKDGAIKIDGEKIHDLTCARMDIEGKVLQSGKRKFVKVVFDA